MKPLLLKKPEKVEHSPTLNTVLMVEETIREAKQVISIGELKRRLPKKVNHYTLKYILYYLQSCAKIEFTPDGLIWICMPKENLDLILKKGRAWN